jgi:hypothetical protein
LVGFALAALTWVGPLALLVEGTPVRDAHRMVNGQSVDLTPLFQWWAKQSDNRPLAAWVHVTGEIVGTNAGGWLVSAQLDDKGGGDRGENRRILLRNPPLQDRAAFDKLLAQKKALEAQRKNLNHRAEQASSRLQEISEERKAARQQHAQMRGLNAQSSTLKQEEKSAKAQLKPVEGQIAEVDKQLKQYPSADHYVVDCFALKTAEQASGAPVFDHGTTFR